MSSVPPVHPPKAILRAAGRHWPFLVVLSLYLMLAAGYRHAVPAWEAPDEPQHFAYVAYLRAHGGPPIQDSREGHNPVVIGYHPPLYYYLAALLTLPLDLSDVRRVVPNPYFSFANDDGGANTVDHTGEGQITPQALAALGRIRALSILLGAGTVLCTYLSGLLMFGDRRWQWAGAGQVPATLATGAVGLLPQFVFISSATNNDNAVNFCCALNLLLCLRFVRRVRTQPARVPWGECGLLGLVAGLGLLSKSSAVVCLPLIGLALILVARRQRSRALFLQGTLAAAAACVAVAGWWFVRSQILYGDFTSWNLLRQNWASVDQLGTVQVSAAFLGHTGTRWFTTFWGTFGWLNLPFEPAVYQEAVLLVGLAVGGLLGLGLAQLRRRSAGAPDADPSTGVGVLLAGLNILLTGLTALVYALTFGDAGTQGRYLFPALPACALLFSAGLCGPLGALRRLGTPTLAPYACGLLVGLVVAGGSWLNLHALDAVIRPAYLTPAEVRRQVVVPALPAGAVPVRPPAAFAPGMWLEGYAVAPRQPDRQAGPLTVTLYWRAGAATAENWLGFVHVTDGVHDLAQSEGPPGAGHYQVYKWRVGELVRDTRILALSDSQARQVQQATGPLRLYVGWIRAGDGARAFLADGADGVTLAWP